MKIQILSYLVLSFIIFSFSYCTPNNSTGSEDNLDTFVGIDTESSDDHNSKWKTDKFQRG